jgi:hypothetical protein
MLHTASPVGGNAQSSYAMTLHRERVARLARMSEPLPVPVPVVIYPAYVFANDAQHGHVKTCATNPGRVREIQDLVCKNLGVRREDMLSQRRFRESVMARQIAMYLCKRHTPNSFPDIGRRFGDRDHTTVLSAVKRVELILASPVGTRVSDQWQADACDFVRSAVSVAQITISKWGDDRTTRTAHPARSR